MTVDTKLRRNFVVMEDTGDVTKVSCCFFCHFLLVREKTLATHASGSTEQVTARLAELSWERVSLGLKLTLDDIRFVEEGWLSLENDF